MIEEEYNRYDEVLKDQDADTLTKQQQKSRESVATEIIQGSINGNDEPNTNRHCII